ncbi:PiggyBac transposable element-derived protein 4, partial [Cucumispora dikerogammari]
MFFSFYSPNQQLAIDEGVCKYQGRYSFKTYNPAKPIKIGMKFYIMADSKTSFVCSMSLYTGISEPIKKTVKNLLINYTNKNHLLYMDNFYNSYDLCVELRNEGIYACGTLRPNRGQPKCYNDMKKSMKKFDYICHQKNKVNTFMWY